MRLNERTSGDGLVNFDFISSLIPYLIADLNLSWGFGDAIKNN